MFFRVLWNNLKNNENMKKIRTTNIFFLTMTVICSCVLSCGPLELSREDALSKLQELSPIDGATFYVENRENNPVLDTLYSDCVIPALTECDYFSIRDLTRILNSTPVYESVASIKDEKAKDIQSEIELELDSICLAEHEMFDKHYMSSLEMGIDSLLEVDVEKIMDDYAGGIFNIKKLTFLLGRDRNDFKEKFWNKFDTTKYQNYIKDFVESYCALIDEKQNDYCNDLIGESFHSERNIVVPNFTIGLSQSTLAHVSSYTQKQKDEICIEAIKDYAVPLALGAVSGGAYSLYDLGNTTYDITTVVEEVKNAKIDDDEMVKYVCQHDLAYQIRNFYLVHWTKQIHEYIDKSNNALKQYIIENFLNSATL